MAVENYFCAENNWFKIQGHFKQLLVADLIK